MRLSFSFYVPVVVDIEFGKDEDGEPVETIVHNVNVVDETDIGACGGLELDEDDAKGLDEEAKKKLLDEAVAAANACQDWPAWEFGF